ncbi:MAG: Gfo/Idh/MocA family oxidoreductase [Candidatus Poribacteria bacterium]|nr:Gfo/Idh/MocA family oxidoreductase [Candidatus Poribacteria bacterium]
MRGIVVGLGGRARSWISVCHKNKDVEIVGYVDPVPEQRAKAAEQFNLPGAQLFPSISDALQKVQADFALDVTPPKIHEAVAVEAFEAGLHLIGEKPLSDDFEAAKRIVKASKAAGKTHMVTQNYRFGSQPRTTHRLLKEGVIGEPAQVTVGFYRAWATRPGTHYTTMPYPLITDMGIHHFDLLRYVMDREPLRVYARTWNPPWGFHAGDAGHTAVIDFDGGLVTTHHALGSSTGKQSPWNGEWRIEGPDGSLTWEENKIFWTRAYPPDQGIREEMPLDDLPLLGQDAILAEFITALREGREPECSGTDNLKSLAIVFAAIQSSIEKRTVEIAEIMGA